MDTVKYSEAIKLLPRGRVHTFRQSGSMLIGADWERKHILNAMRKAKEILITGKQAQAMNHGLAIEDKNGLLFIATKPVRDAKVPNGNG
ncbi:hypothetical protein KKH13_05030 [Patescibacteria group bacterium]|nr:hypothetical protein [Patescibacteria group bacterium]